jgi:hypothetical protein
MTIKINPTNKFLRMVGISHYSISNFGANHMPICGHFIFFVCSMLVFICCSTAEKNTDPQWKLVWSDDFGYTGLPRFYQMEL